MSKLAKFIFSIVFVLGVSVYAYAQVPGNGQALRNGNQASFNRLAKVKKEYLSRQLSLTPDEAKKFWPLYRQYQQQLVTINRAKRRNNTDAQTNGTKQIDLALYYETELLNTHKRYKDEFLKILPAEKVSELYKSETKFNEELLKQLSERGERAGN